MKVIPKLQKMWEVQVLRYIYYTNSRYYNSGEVFRYYNRKLNKASFSDKTSVISSYYAKFSSGLSSKEVKKRFAEKN